MIVDEDGDLDGGLGRLGEGGKGAREKGREKESDLAVLERNEKLLVGVVGDL